MIWTSSTSRGKCWMNNEEPFDRNGDEMIIQRENSPNIHIMPMDPPGWVALFFVSKQGPRHDYSAVLNPDDLHAFMIALTMAQS